METKTPNPFTLIPETLMRTPEMLRKIFGKREEPKRGTIGGGMNMPGYYGMSATQNPFGLGDEDTMALEPFLGDAPPGVPPTDPRITQFRVGNPAELDGLLQSLAAIRQGNANARAGMNDVPPSVATLDPPESRLGSMPMEHASALRARAGSSGGSAMAKPISMEDDRRRAALVQLRAEQGSQPTDDGTLASRAQSAMDRLVADPSRNLSMDMTGQVVGQGGTPVDESKAMAANLARAAKHAEAMTTLKRNRQLKAAGMREVPLPHGMDPMLFGMPAPQVAQIMSTREAGKNNMQMAFMEAMARMNAQAAENASREKIAGMQFGPRPGDLTPEQKARFGMYSEAVGAGSMAPDEALGKIFTQPGAAGAIPSLPKVADPTAAIEQIFNEASSAGITDPAQFAAHAKSKGISLDQLREWKAKNAISLPTALSPNPLFHLGRLFSSGPSREKQQQTDRRLKLLRGI